MSDAVTDSHKQTILASNNRQANITHTNDILLEKNHLTNISNKKKIK